MLPDRRRILPGARASLPAVRRSATRANEPDLHPLGPMAVILVSFGSFAFADAGARFISPAARFRTACYGGMLCVGASVLACYALLTYRWRARHILAKDQPEWGDPQGPLW